VNPKLAVTGFALPKAIIIGSGHCCCSAAAEMSRFFSRSQMSLPRGINLLINIRLGAQSGGGVERKPHFQNDFRGGFHTQDYKDFLLPIALAAIKTLYSAGKNFMLISSLLNFMVFFTADTPPRK
jgi:hypothetical protein